MSDVTAKIKYMAPYHLHVFLARILFQIYNYSYLCEVNETLQAELIIFWEHWSLEC